MDLNFLIDSIKSAVSIEDAVRSVGINIERGGRCCCPFHGDKHPSMKLYPNGTYYCFACHEGGDTFRFVRKMLGLTAKETVKWFDDEFSLNLPVNAKPDREKIEKARRERELKQVERDTIEFAKNRAFERYLDDGRLLGQYERDRTAFAPKDCDSEWDKRFCESLRRSEETRERIEEYEVGQIDLKKLKGVC